MRSLMPRFVAFLAALLVSASAFAQEDDRLFDEEWEDLGEAQVEEPETGGAPPPAAAQPAPAPEAPPGEADAERAFTMKLVSASTASGSLAFVGTGVGVGLALSIGALLSLMPNPPALVTWLAFIVLPAGGAFGGAVAGALGFNEPTFLAVTGGGALAGAGIGSLVGWGIGAAFALGDPGPFPGENEHTFKTAAGIFLGMGLGAFAGAATTAPFMYAKPWEKTGEEGAERAPAVAMWME